MGWAAQLGRQQVGGQVVLLSLSLFYFLFSIFMQLCGFIKNTKSIPKNMKLLMTTVGIYPTVNISIYDYLGIGKIL